MSSDEPSIMLKLKVFLSIILFILFHLLIYLSLFPLLINV